VQWVNNLTWDRGGGNSLLYVVYYEFGTTINSWIGLDYCNMGTGLGNMGTGLGKWV